MSKYIRYVQLIDMLDLPKGTLWVKDGTEPDWYRPYEGHSYRGVKILEKAVDTMDEFLALPVMIDPEWIEPKDGEGV